MPPNKRVKISRGGPPPKANRQKEASPDESVESTSEPEQEPEQEPEKDVTTNKAESAKTFKDLGIVDSLVEACDRLGYTNPTPIQAQSIPHALQNRDVIGLAETGSGKTAAFALPIIQALLDKPSHLFGLVLAPTRELAAQIAASFEALGSLVNLRVAVIVGGLDMVAQAIALGKKPHIVVATPGRLVDHLEKTKGFSLRSLKYLVMDEADRLLDMDFGPSIDKILKFIPRERRTFLFSATMSSKIESLQRASLRDPVRISISSSSHQTVSTLIQNYIFCPHNKKDTYLVYLVNEYSGKKIVLFTRTVTETQRLAILLRTLGFGAIPIHGQLNQTARLGALNKFRAGSRDILVATDVAARGLDIPLVDVVINFDIPSDSKTYVHRVGRTARAGKSGKAITIMTQYDLEIYLRIEAALGKKLPEYPTQKDEVDVFQTRVEEAQRVARIEMKNMMDAKGKRGTAFKGGKGGKRRHDNMDAEEG
ncbi:ATP-dependent rRNA helicase RRP3 [Colletotrichum sp. SAR11_59]|uniref:ATP-dependent rRNA helicase RRP3 n=1 Tax=Colletotrichum asianum TaxID=702518 RepID=A0A8H3VXW1_9PEZI|nr:ATP-dependent rRNA helicase rrp3 [Colletotrichum asianum]KAI8304719.1 ATP-dependent rRNA helicase RRP3 [Colletotrichum sp. SAR11_59]